MLLYHGSNIQVSNPQILKSDRRLDFGKGFYLTSSFEQASRWAELTVKRRETGKEAVSVFEFDGTSVSDVLINESSQQYTWIFASFHLDTIFDYDVSNSGKILPGGDY